MKKLLILGVNGFIGHHLSEAVMRETDWHVYGMDLESDRVAHLLDSPTRMLAPRTVAAILRGGRADSAADDVPGIGDAVS